MIGSDFQKARLLKTYSKRDIAIMGHLAQHEIDAEIRKQRAANPDEEIFWVKTDDPGCYIAIRARGRLTLEEIQDERPWLADSYGKDPEPALESIKQQRRILRDWFIFVLIFIVGFTIAVFNSRGEAGPEPIDAMPDGVSWTNTLDNGCTFDHRQIEGITWIIPRRNEAYYAGICGEAEMAR